MPETSLSETRRPDNRHPGLEGVPEEPLSSGYDDASDELGRRLMNAIADLPGEQRDVLLLQEQGFSQAEIAEITGAIAETVKSRLRYARKALRQQLGGEE